MSLYKQYTLLARHVARIEDMIQVLERDYSSFVTPTCLKSFSDEAGLDFFHGIEDIQVFASGFYQRR